MAGRSSNVLDFLLEFFACTDEDDLSVLLPEAGEARLEALGEAYRVFSAASWRVLPRVPDGEVRPFIPTSSVYDVEAWARGGFNFGQRELEDLDSTYQVVDRIKHRLLYCHSVALDDPLWQLVSLAAAQARLGSQGFSAAEALRNYANLLLHLKHLLRKQIVCPIFTENLLGSAGGQSARVNRAKLEGAVVSVLEGHATTDEACINELIAAAPAGAATHLRQQLSSHAGGDLVRSVFGEIAAERLATALSAAIESDGRTTLYLPFRQDVRALAHCVTRIESVRAAATRLPPDQSYILSPLLDLQLPGLHSLQPEEIIGIRKNASEFEAFRRDLRQTLLAAEAIPAHVLNRGAEVKRLVDERMKESLSNLDTSMTKSPVLRAMRVGTTALVSGTVGAAASAAFDPTGTATLITLALVLGQLTGATISAVADLAESASGPSGSAIAARSAHYLAVLR